MSQIEAALPPLPAAFHIARGQTIQVQCDLYTASQVQGFARAALSQQSPAPSPDIPEKPMQVTEEMVSRFLTWRLPDDFGPDCGIAFAKFHPNGTTRYEPVGTNLLTAPQARAMLEHVLASPAPSVEPPDQVHLAQATERGKA